MISDDIISKIFLNGPIRLSTPSRGAFFTATKKEKHIHILPDSSKEGSLGFKFSVDKIIENYDDIRDVIDNHAKRSKKLYNTHFSSYLISIVSHIITINDETTSNLFSKSENDKERLFEKYTNNAEEILLEGAPRYSYLQGYERNNKLRQKCINHFGYSCQICNFNFEETYGPTAKDFIEVHHIVPLHKFKEEQQIDPTKDLIPVCSNCHSIFHLKMSVTPFPDEVRKLISLNKQKQ